MGALACLEAAAARHSWTSLRRPTQMKKVGGGVEEAHLPVAISRSRLCAHISSPGCSICGSRVCSLFSETRRRTRGRGFTRGCRGRQIGGPPKMSPSSFPWPGIFHAAKGMEAAGVIKAANQLTFRRDRPGVSRGPVDVEGEESASAWERQDRLRRVWRPRKRPSARGRRCF